MRSCEVIPQEREKGSKLPWWPWWTTRMAETAELRLRDGSHERGLGVSKASVALRQILATRNCTSKKAAQQAMGPFLGPVTGLTGCHLSMGEGEGFRF